MELTYKQKNTYQILCDEKQNVSDCTVIIINEIYADGIYVSSFSSSEEVPLDKMKKIIEELKRD